MSTESRERHHKSIIEGRRRKKGRKEGSDACRGCGSEEEQKIGATDVTQ